MKRPDENINWPGKIILTSSALVGPLWLYCRERSFDELVAVSFSSTDWLYSFLGILVVFASIALFDRWASWLSKDKDDVAATRRGAQQGVVLCAGLCLVIKAVAYLL